MSQTPFLYGAGGIVLGFISGIAIGGWTSESKISDALSAAMSPGQAAAEQSASEQSAALGALGERIAALEAAMPTPGAIAEDLSSALDERLAALQSGLSDQISANAEAQTSALDEAISGLSAGLQQSAQTAAAAVVAEQTGADTSSAGGVSMANALSVGETAVFAEGKVRAFVSRLDPDGGSARLMINGEQAVLGAGGKTRVSFDGKSCSVVVMGLNAGGVSLGADCDEAKAEPAMAASGGTGSQPPAPEEGFRAGQTAMLADGGLRVFVSGLAADGSAARLAVNGLGTEVVASGDSIEVAGDGTTCTLTVTGVGNGMVGLEGNCG